jgi:hypothetical protein
MKYIIEIVEIDKRPENWTSAVEWPGPAMYVCKDDPSMYHVMDYAVNYIGEKKAFMTRPVSDAELNPITEDLLLKAIAAASRAEKLK